ncbi:MAG: ferrochelatase [Alphaproteobacteria bacterium]|nr:ferrochelatase [Alphaproteobacteria bacterium]
MKPAVVLANIGSPAALSETAIRDYLRAFLSDREVVNLPPLLWQPILRGIILPRRPRALLHSYQTIWDHHRDASPLLSLGQCLADKLAVRLGSAPCHAAMQYSPPALEEVLVRLRRRRILVIGLYPQEANATCGALRKQVSRLLRRHPDLEIEFLSPWYDRQDYIASLAAQVRRAHGQTPFGRLLVAFHGLPQQDIDRGSPYKNHCETTFNMLAAAVKDLPLHAEIAYQSRFGPARWMQPYAIDRVRELASHRSLAVINPGFPVDCLETIHEIGVELREVFRDAGGETFVRIPCLNAGDDQVNFLVRLIEEHLRAAPA